MPIISDSLSCCWSGNLHASTFERLNIFTVLDSKLTNPQIRTTWWCSEQGDFGPNKILLSEARCPWVKYQMLSRCRSSSLLLIFTVFGSVQRRRQENNYLTRINIVLCWSFFVSVGLYLPTWNIFPQLLSTVVGLILMHSAPCTWNTKNQGRGQSKCWISLHWRLTFSRINRSKHNQMKRSWCKSHWCSLWLVSWWHWKGSEHRCPSYTVKLPCV